MKKKLLISCLIIVLFSSFIILLVPTGVAQLTSAITAGTTANLNGTYSPPTRLSFHTQGRFWVFYCAASPDRVMLITSTDGLTWSEPTLICHGPTGSLFDAALINATHFCYTRTSSSSYTGLYYRMGQLNVDGTITWVALEQTIHSDVNRGVDPVISVDSNGYPWIGCKDISGVYSSESMFTVYHSTTKEGTWTPAQNDPAIFTDYTKSGTQELVALTNGKLYFIIAGSVSTGPIQARGYLYDGSNWGSMETFTSSYVTDFYFNQFNALAVGDNVFFAFTKDGSNDVMVVKREFGVGWESEVKLGNGNIDSAPVLTADSAGGVYACWIYGLNVYLRVYDDDDGWGAIDVLCLESSVYYRYLLNGAEYANNGRLSYIWLQGSYPNYNIRFATLKVNEEPEPTPSPSSIPSPSPSPPAPTPVPTPTPNLDNMTLEDWKQFWIWLKSRENSANWGEYLEDLRDEWVSEFK